MFKITIDNEEVLCDKDFTINEEMLNTSSVILNNVFPKTWEQDKDYVSRFYYPKDYSKCKIFEETIHPEEKSTAEGTSFSIEVDTTKQYEIQTLKGQTTQSGTPTPSSPQPINITTGRQVVSVSDGITTNDYEINLGKNLFNKNNFDWIRNNDGNYTNQTDTSTIRIRMQTLLLLEGGETYTISGIPSGMTLNAVKFYSSPSATTQTSLVQTATFTVPTSSPYVIIQLAGTGFDSSTNTLVKNADIQIEKGSQASSFSPYKPPIYLGKIGTYQDCIFKNTQDNPLYDSNLEEGQWYIHKEVNRTVITDDNKDIIVGFTSSEYGHPRVQISKSNLGYTSNWDSNVYLFNKYSKVTSTSAVANGTYAPNFAQWVIYIYNDDFTSLANARSVMLGTIIYNPLATPTNTLIEDEELINQLNSIQLLEGLNNVSVSSANLPFIMSLLYNYVPEHIEEEMLFCGMVKNTGEISLNPRYPHYCNIQVLDFKDFLSQGETLDFVITDKTIEEAIDQVIGTIAPYGFIKGNIELDLGSYELGAYSTKDKTAYDVFNYIADITQSRWTTRMIDENTIAIDFYDPEQLPQGTAIEYTQSWFENNKIDDMSFSYSSNDYRNKQVMLSGEVYSNVQTTEIIVADGYQTQFNTLDKIGKVSKITIDGTPATIITKDEENLGYEGDFIFQPGNRYFESDTLLTSGKVIIIVYYAIIEGREIILNQQEIERVGNMTDRKGIIARYENRNDATTTYELQQIGKAYIKYKGTPEISLKVSSRSNIWNVGNRVQFTAPLTELTTEYMVKRKTIERITTIEDLFYEYELTSSFNMERDVNYFDNQRYKSNGNIGEGEFISRNIDINNTANIIFYDLEVNEITMTGTSDLQADLEAPLGVE